MTALAIRPWISYFPEKNSHLRKMTSVAAYGLEGCTQIAKHLISLGDEIILTNQLAMKRRLARNENYAVCPNIHYLRAAGGDLSSGRMTCRIKLSPSADTVLPNFDARTAGS